MRKMMIFHRMAGISLAAACFLASCNLPAPTGPAPMTETPVVSSNQVAFVTDTPIPTVTSTPMATLPATDAATPTIQLSAQVIPKVNANCRKGPNTAYDQVTIVEQGNAYNVIGQNDQNGQTGKNVWWLVQGRGSIVCWVSDVNVTRQGSVEQAQIDTAPPLPGTPSKFVNSYVCDTKAKTLAVKLSWAAAAGVTGYNIYRNGGLLKAVGAKATSYLDDAPLGKDLVYDLEAFNDYGVAARLSTNVPACK